MNELHLKNTAVGNILELTKKVPSLCVIVPSEISLYLIIFPFVFGLSFAFGFPLSSSPPTFIQAVWFSVYLPTCIIQREKD